jgi:hypothetical protein
MENAQTEADFRAFVQSSIESGKIAALLRSSIEQGKIEIEGRLQEDIIADFLDHCTAVIKADFFAHLKEILSVSKDLIEGTFRFAVVHGDVKITDRSAEEIIADFIDELTEIVRSEEVQCTNWTAVMDFRGTLLKRAETEEIEGHDEIALTFYALWFEHAINATITTAMTRKGYSSDVIKPLVRKLSHREKATSPWAIAELPLISEEHLKLLDTIGSLRNEFVHYK